MVLTPPVEEHVTDVPSIPNPSTAMIVDELRKVRKVIEEQSERRETPAPAQIRLPYSGHTRLRVVTWHLHPAAAGTYALLVGADKKSTLKAPVDGCIPEPLPITIEGGNNISVIDNATGQPVTVVQVADSFLMAFTE